MMRTLNREEKKRAPRGKSGKVSFVQGVRNRIGELAGLGRTLVDEPRSFPAELGRFFKRSIRTIWNARGGGLYACGFVVTFVYLEIKTVAGEVFESESALAFVTEQFFEMFFRLISESFVNSILAFAWPFFLLGWSPSGGLAILLLLYYVFPRYIKPPLTRWLFDDRDGVR